MASQKVLLGKGVHREQRGDLHLHLYPHSHSYVHADSASEHEDESHHEDEHSSVAFAEERRAGKGHLRLVRVRVRVVSRFGGADLWR
ncbi:uncharacterized protein TrAtP1_012775 [Trichoderma atroviride]|uniref:uncharacterized protein n=1 Tax=Hypocrea atroviridis TaxID=63577 RepID=UPI003316A7B0|nr:hypothetical protein TrAtP1_012775 [Trichoderma atroviride]